MFFISVKEDDTALENDLKMYQMSLNHRKNTCS